VKSFVKPIHPDVPQGETTKRKMTDVCVIRGLHILEVSSLPRVRSVCLAQVIACEKSSLIMKGHNTRYLVVTKHYDERLWYSFGVNVAKIYINIACGPYPLILYPLISTGCSVVAGSVFEEAFMPEHLLSPNFGLRLFLFDSS